eukprot:GHVS01066468.1.p1 GENE.GHVS01066468.1~~GHVS01066468.1.p1  ORF type:complete len:505 (-),score=102.68 GHVS01066468.1:28-1542(-)
MGKGAIHPNGSNFRRFPCRFDIVEKVRRLVDQRVYDRPQWLDAVERAPPMELHALQLNQRRFNNPYPSLVKTILLKYPHLRFQDCYVDGNDWSKGNDRYRDDHPVMQFAAYQLKLMHQGITKRNAFKQAESHFYERRMKLEKQQKVMMALAVDEKVDPVFTSGHAYWQSQIAEDDSRHLIRIRNILRALRRRSTSINQTVTSDSPPPLPSLFPRSHQRASSLRQKAFELDLSDSSSLTSAAQLGKANANIPTSRITTTTSEGVIEKPAVVVGGNVVSVPMDPSHTAKKSVAFDPLYAGRHGLFLDEAVGGHTPPEQANRPSRGDETSEHETEESFLYSNDEGLDQFGQSSSSSDHHQAYDEFDETLGYQTEERHQQQERPTDHNNSSSPPPHHHPWADINTSSTYRRARRDADGIEYGWGDDEHIASPPAPATTGGAAGGGCLEHEQKRSVVLDDGAQEEGDRDHLSRDRFLEQPVDERFYHGDDDHHGDYGGEGGGGNTPPSP